MHICHNPNCGRPLPAHLVAHPKAWFALPKSYRDAIWQNYRTGQERDKQPSVEYMAVLLGCISYWQEHGTKC